VSSFEQVLICASNDGSGDITEVKEVSGLEQDLRLVRLWSFSNMFCRNQESKIFFRR